MGFREFGDCAVKMPPHPVLTVSWPADSSNNPYVKDFTRSTTA